MADPVGEDGWLALVDEASRIAGNIEQRIGVLELYERAVAAEPWSIKLQLAYCEWIWSLHTDCQNGDAGWPEEEQIDGQEIFTLEMALNRWNKGARATQYRLNDSHELWNRWISIELEQLTTSSSKESIDHIRENFMDRLQTPHSTWDDTSQMFSQFLTKYDEVAWESIMVQATQSPKTKVAKELYGARESYELKLQQAVRSGDNEAIKSQTKDYLEWEQSLGERKVKKGIQSPAILCVALYERAMSSTVLGLDPTVWEDYVVYLTGTHDEAEADDRIPSAYSVVEKATRYCPWSGILWSRLILTAELENLPFATIEQIKLAATNTSELDRDGMASVVDFYIAWCGFLKRMTIAPGATEEVIDYADMGLREALEHVQNWGKKRHGKEWKGDPLFRIERLYIQHLTQKGSLDEARGIWRKLVKSHADSYEFWQQYYLWEMTVKASAQAPILATAVLVQAVNQRTLDWPEKMMEIYVRHCNNFEGVDALLHALNYVHRTSKKVAKRREREAAEAAAMYAQQQPTIKEEAIVETESPSGASKRKREVTEEVDGAVTKRTKTVDKDALRDQHQKRDRENTTVLVENLPVETTQTKVRQYFKEYGHINSITWKIELDKLSSSALIEFRSPEEAQSALLRNGKYFFDKQIKVTPGTGLTLFVTNYPPTANDTYLHELFKDCGEIFNIRWPSLKYNTHRRFCYISFRTPEAAAEATYLDGTLLEDRYKLSAKYSDPANKKDRESAAADHRELHITGLDHSLNEEDIKEVFSKYGEVERVRLLTKPTGESKGAGFVSFKKKEEAKAALELDKTKLKARVITVELSVEKNFKPTATSGGGTSASPAPDPDGDSVMSASPAPDSHSNTHALHAPSRHEATNRTMALMNIPDTVNDARIRLLAESHGQIVKLTLRPDHQGAIIEYADAASAGKAALALENHEIAPGRKLRTGGLKDLFSEKDEIKADRIQIGQGKKAVSGFMQQAAPIRRPGAAGRGGLGQKKGLGFSGVKAGGSVPSAGGGNTQWEENKKPKSNADFKAMFLSGGTK
jgi:RNA recognition motif-containing protein